MPLSSPLSRIDGRITRQDIEGPITLHLVLDAEDHIHQASLEITPHYRNWASIIVFHNSCLFCEDAKENLHGIMARLKSAGTLSTVCSFVIAPEADGYNQMGNLAAEMHANSGNIFSVFGTFDEALAWCREELIKLDKEQ